MTTPSRAGEIVALVLAAALLMPVVASAQGAAPPNLVYVPLTPCRVINTGLISSPLIAGVARTFLFRGTNQDYSGQGGNGSGCGIPGLSTLASPANLAKAVAVNIFAVSPVGDGDIRAWPSNQVVPLAAVLTYSHVGTLAFANGTILTMCDQAQVSPCSLGDITFRADFGTTNLIVDVVGYFTEASTLGSNTNFAIGHGALSANTTGSGNTAAGAFALQSNTGGRDNTAVGYSALLFNSGDAYTGIRNTAVGNRALKNNTSGNRNTAVGMAALASNTTAGSSTAVGYAALLLANGSTNTAVGDTAAKNTSSGAFNTAVGDGALTTNSIGNLNTAIGHFTLYSATGGGNIGLGSNAGSSVTSGSNNIEIGTSGNAADSGVIRIGSTGIHTQAFIAGIESATSSGGVPVLVNSNGQLGTVTSSRRFKEDIRDLADASDRIFDLRPVSFRYKANVVQGERPTEFGLIAEEVEQAFPELVVYGKDGQPQTVKYHLLVPLLLNELQKERAARLAIEARDVAREGELEEQRQALAALTKRVEMLIRSSALPSQGSPPH